MIYFVSVEVHKNTGPSSAWFDDACMWHCWFGGHSIIAYLIVLNTYYKDVRNPICISSEDFGK